MSVCEVCVSVCKLAVVAGYANRLAMQSQVKLYRKILRNDSRTLRKY